MNVKNSIRKVGAVAASGLMVGLSVGAASSLSDFPEPFVEDGEVASQIVVGSTGQVADVVGAVNIAAALGHSAVQTEETEVEGGVTADVDGVEADTPLRAEWDSGADASLDNLNYDRLHFGTMETDDDEDRLVEESVGLDAGEVTVGTNSTEVYTEIGEDSIMYTADYETGFAADDELLVLGETYTITEVSDSDDEVRLGTREEHRNLAAGDTVEHAMWSFEIIDVDRDANEVRLDVFEDGEFQSSATLNQTEQEDFGDDDEFRIDVQDVWFGDALDQVHIDTVYTDTIVEDGEPSPFDADWEASLEFDENDDEEDVVTELELHNLVELEHDHDDDEDYTGEALQGGDAFAGPGDYFHVYHMGMTDADTEDISFSDENEVSFTDPLTIEHTLDLTEWDQDGTDNLDSDTEGFVVVDRGDNEHVPVMYDSDGDELTLEYRGTELEVDPTEEATGDDAHSVGGVEVEISGNQFDNAEDDLHTLHNGIIDYDGNQASFIENAEETMEEGFWAAGNPLNGVAIAYDGDDIDEVWYAHYMDYVVLDEDLELTDEDLDEKYDLHEDWEWDGDAEEWQWEGEGDAPEIPGEDDVVSLDEIDESRVVWHPFESNLEAEDDPEYSQFGSIIEFADDDEVTIENPSEWIQVEHAFGDSDTTEVEGETVETVADQDDLPDLAQLDEESMESDHLILVGGPAVNTLTEELHDDGEIDLDDIEEDGSGALIEVVEDAFSSGQHAMVVAGYGADDTRSASQYIAQHRTNADALADAGDSLVLTEADYPAEQ